MTTVAIIDFAHSGTTMLAGLCHILGCPMVGDRYKSKKWEDLDVIEAIRDEVRFAELVGRRNAQRHVWGFKMPGAWKFPNSLAHLRDPVYLAIYKDPVSVTMRRFGKLGLGKVGNTLEQMRLSTEGLASSGLPVHVMSYHWATQNPGAFVKHLVNVTGLTPDYEQVVRAAAFIQPNANRLRQPYPEVEPWI